jgi:hypothetical protein
MKNSVCWVGYFRPLVLAAVIGMLGGCAAQYRSEEFGGLNGGGYTEERGPGQLIRVSFKVYTLGGATMHMVQVSTLYLYRCAEIAEREGKPYFALYQTLPDALSDKRSGKNLVTTVSGRPASYAYILLHDQNDTGLLSTAEILAQLGPKVRGKTQ